MRIRTMKKNKIKVAKEIPEQSCNVNPLTYLRGVNKAITREIILKLGSLKQPTRLVFYYNLMIIWKLNPR